MKLDPGSFHRASAQLNVTPVLIAVMVVLLSFAGLAYSTRNSPSSNSASCIAKSSSVSSYTLSMFATGSTASVQATTGIIVPLFTNSTAQRIAEVDQIIQVKASEPVVPMIVVFNLGGGPGNNYGSLVSAQIRGMQAAGITVLGYDPTSWGEKSISTVESVMLTWHDWYAVNGTYLDQMPNWSYNGPNDTLHYSGPNGESISGYFTTLDQYGKSLGMTKVVANAGADVPKDFVGSVDTIGTFENPFLPSPAVTAGWTSVLGLGGWHRLYDKSNFMFFSYDITSLSSGYVLTAAKYYGYMYITNGTEAVDRYNTLSPYLNQLASILASTASSSSGHC